ncbi:T9SS type A sorting domain-containing protein [Phaeodactylibacter xiamenensis]|uniref:T9SS type A sorting domain-containing protein n=2 Tax=Phaeodactylibacter xiamenensis TaxID=1524460 RepID=UPI003CCB966F
MTPSKNNMHYDTVNSCFNKVRQVGLWILSMLLAVTPAWSGHISFISATDILLIEPGGVNEAPKLSRSGIGGIVTVSSNQADTYQAGIKTPKPLPGNAQVAEALPTCPATGTLTWTGAADTDWGNASNWDAGCVPIADNEVVIPDVVNAPVIMDGTAAAAMTVMVMPDASLTLEAMGSLTLEGATGMPSGGLYNQGTVTNNGQIDIGPSISPGEYGLVNEGSFSNEAGSELSIDRTGNIGLWNKGGTLANEGKIITGAVVGTSRPGIYNEGDIQNNGGEIEIDRYNGAGIDNRPNSTISNSGRLAIGQLSGPLNTCIYNFGHIQNLASGKIELDNGSSGIFTTTTGGVSSSFTNAGEIAIGQIANIGGPGIYNQSASGASALFENKADGEILIDRFSVGIHNELNSSFDNSGLIKIAPTVLGTGPAPALYNRSTFNNYAGAEIQIDRISRTGLQHDEGTFTNGGKIIVGINVTITNFSPGVYNEATFVNQADAEIHIDRFTHVGFQNAFNSSMTNAGLIKIGENVLGGNNGLYNDGTFENQATGEIHVDNIPDGSSQNGVFNASGDTFTNAGKIFIGSTSGAGSTGLFNGGNFFNNGEISVDNVYNSSSGDHGLYHRSGSFLNTGKISIGTTGSAGDWGIYTSSTFDNEADGEIAIDRCGISGLRNGSVGGGAFTNAGKLAIGANETVGDWGLWNENQFNNSGELSIDNSTVTGLRHQSDSFENTGTIVLGGNTGIGEWGLWNQAAFTNGTSGEISIDRTSNTGLLLFSNTFANSGTVSIGASAAVGAQAIYNNGSLDNETCAVLNIYAPLYNDATLNNSGVVLSSTAEPHTNSGFTNEGVIAYPGGNPIPNVTNNEIIVAPVTSNSCNAVSPAFTLSSPTDFDIAGVFTDEAATLSAGTYAVATNTFTPTESLEEDTYSYFVQIADPVGGCTRTVPWNLTIVSLFPSDAFLPAGTTLADPFTGVTDYDTDHFICGGEEAVYGTQADASDIDVTWSISGGGTILAGDNTSNVKVRWENPGIHTLTFVATNVVSGCTSTNSLEVTVDGDAPVIFCEDITVELDANGEYMMANDEALLSITDDCHVLGPFTEGDPGARMFDCNDVGMTFSRTMVANDVAGNQGYCNYNVTVEDNTAPTAICLNTTVELQPDGLYHLQQSDVYDAANSSDNCPYLPALGGPVPGAIDNVSFPSTTFGCDDVGLTFPVTVTLTDPSGNSDDCTATVTVEAGTALPPGWAASDIGDQGAGSGYAYDPCARKNPNRGDFTVSTGAYNLIPNNSDNLAFIGRELCNNGGIQARIEDVSGGYAGLMIRESSAPGAKMVAVYSNLTSLLRREIRTIDDGPRASNTSFAPFPYWLRLVRQNDYIRAFYRTSDNGSWTLFHQAYLPMQPCVEMGLAVFTTDPNGQAQATFSRVQWQSNAGGNSLALFNEGAAAAQPEEREASVFPNPARDAFTLAFSKAPESGGTAILRNQMGQALEQRQLQPGEAATEWDVSSLPAGLYFLEVRQEGWPPQVLRVVKSH